MSIRGGLKADPDGRVRGVFTHNPSSLRLSMTSPSLHQIPRGASDIERWVKDIFVAPEGNVLYERDFSAIEAVLVGYFAGDPTYIRFAKLGVHDYLASHLLGRPADLAWSDGDLKGYFKEIKASHTATRDKAKTIVHMSNYLGSARKIHELFPETIVSVAEGKRLQDLYFALFPAVRKWQKDLCVRVDGTKRRAAGEEGGPIDPWTLGTCYARNPFGYVHHFYSVLNWEKVGSEWVSSFGDDAKRLVSFLPQSTAAAIIKKAAKALFYQHREPVGESLRVLIHDSILGECAEKDLDECLRVTQEVMEAPIPELPLDPTWGLGTHLSIGSEAKSGKSWGGMA